jgi:hypothetical protein
MWLYDLPDKRADTSSGRHQGLPHREQDHALLIRPLARTRHAVDKTPVIIAGADARIVPEPRTARRHGCKRRKPHEYHEAIEDENSEGVIVGLERSKLLRKEDVCENDPSDDALVSLVQLLQKVRLTLARHDLQWRGRNPVRQSRRPR